MRGQSAGAHRPAIALLLALAALLLVLSAGRLAQTLFFGGLRLDRMLDAAGRRVEALSGFPPGRDETGVRAAAASDLRSYLTERPLDAGAQFLSYRLARMEGRPVDAELALFRCSVARPADSRIAYTRGIFLLENGRFGEGLAFFRQSLRLDSRQLDAIYDDCMIIFGGRYATFRFIFPEKLEIRKRLAGRLRHDLLLDESIAEYQWCLDRNPDSARLHFELSRACLGNGEIETALAEVEHALGLEPNREDWSCRRGELLLQLGWTEAAVEVCRTLIASNPNYKDAYILWARCFEQEGQQWEAIGIYREALWRVHEKGVIHRLIGEQYMKMGRQREALEEFQAGLRTAVNDYSRKFALFRIGTCYLRMGRQDLALESLVAADAIHPEFKDLEPLVANALERLTAGTSANDE